MKLLQLKFAENKPDLIVPVSYAALQFLLDEAKKLFPRTPVVAVFNVRKLDEVQRRIASGSAGSDITGVASTDEPARTLDLACKDSALRIS